MILFVVGYDGAMFENIVLVAQLIFCEIYNFRFFGNKHIYIFDKFTIPLDPDVIQPWYPSVK